MPKLKIEYIETSSLIPYINNSREHSKSQISEIASSIKEFGFTNPVLIDNEKGIIAGHGRLLAGEKLGLSKIPCIVLTGLSALQKKAYIIADNKLALNASWNEEMLMLELEFLSNSDFDMALTGFDDDELSILFDDVEDDDVGAGEPSADNCYQQKRFNLHDEQYSIVDDAITHAKTNPTIDTGVNDSNSSNAITYICEQYLKMVGS